MITQVLLGLSLLFLFQNQNAVAANDALDEVNQTRARAGLAPFIRDQALSQAAAGCADFRASHGLSGHSSNDFGFLPRGASAAAAGCAAWAPNSGWGACCTYERWSYAGAAYAYGTDGRRYMQLFVSNSPNGPVVQSQPATPPAQLAQATQPAQAAPTGAENWVRMQTGSAYYRGNVQVGYQSDDGTFYWLRNGTFYRHQ